MRKKAEVVVVGGGSKERVDLKSALRLLAKRGVTHVLIEGGSEVTGSALAQKVVNELYVFVAPKIIGGKEATGAVGGRGVRRLSQAWTFRHYEWKKIGPDLLLHVVF